MFLIGLFVESCGEWTQRAGGGELGAEKVVLIFHSVSSFFCDGVVIYRTQSWTIIHYCKSNVDRQNMPLYDRLWMQENGKWIYDCFLLWLCSFPTRISTCVIFFHICFDQLMTSMFYGTVVLCSISFTFYKDNRVLVLHSFTFAINKLSRLTDAGDMSEGIIQ